MNNNLINNEKILNTLLASFGVSHVIFSMGAENSSLKREMESSDQYKIYQAIDERNAGYFALGLALELKTPVGVVCNTNAAATNFLPAITEAFYQHLPVLFIAEVSADSEKTDPAIDNTFKTFTKESYHVPLIFNKDQERKNIVNINKTLQSLTLYGTGPVFLSYELAKESNNNIGCFDLPIIKGISAHRDETLWKEKVADLEKAKRIGILVGSEIDINNNALLEFSEKLDCVVIKNTTFFDVLSNNNIDKNIFPEYIITFSETLTEFDRVKINQLEKLPFKHWHVNSTGHYYDMFGKLDTVFIATPDEFLDYFNKTSKTRKGHEYVKSCNIIKNTGILKSPTIEYRIFKALSSNLKQGFVQNSLEIPLEEYDNLEWNNSLIINDTAYSKEKIGCLSTFLGMARYMKTPCYIIIDDICFYNDMNALMLREIHNNIHILLINKHQVSETSYTQTTQEEYRHEDNLKEWAISTGFDYLYFDSIDALIKYIENASGQKNYLPILLEISI